MRITSSLVRALQGLLVESVVGDCPADLAGHPTANSLDGSSHPTRRRVGGGNPMARSSRGITHEYEDSIWLSHLTFVRCLYGKKPQTSRRTMCGVQAAAGDLPLPADETP